MEDLNQIQDYPLDSSKSDNEYTQGESADWDFGEDITDLLQLDDIIAEGPEIDELPNQSCEGHLVDEISQTVNTLENKTYQYKDSKVNNDDDFMHIGLQKSKSLNIKIKNKKCKVDEISCDPYIIEEDVDSIEVQKDFFNEIKKRNELKALKMLVKRDGLYKFIEPQTLKVNEGRQGNQLMSREKSDEILKALVDKNICEKNDQDVGLHCKDCGFYSESVQERIEHLNGVRHKAVKEDLRKEIIFGTLENYTINTFYCTVCSWFITDIQPIIEHILSRRHKDAVLISRYKVPGVMLESFCFECNSILKSNEIYNHMFVHKQHSVYCYISQIRKHVIVRVNKQNEVYCSICNYHIRFDETEKHLKNHNEVCYYFNKHKKCLNSLIACNLPHECAMCRGDHPKIECLLRNEKKISPVIEHEKSKFGQLHKEEMIMPGSSNKKLKGNAIVSESVNDFHREIFRNDTYDSLLPEHADIAMVTKKSQTSYYKQDEDESNTSKPLSKSDIQERISYSDENDKNAYKSFQGSNLSRSPSHRTNDRGISKSDSFNGKYGNSIGIQSGDEGEELNIITMIVKLLEICDLLGNLGSFFTITLKKALEKKECKEDILNILREQSNIILMEVILKKLEGCERVCDMTLYIKIRRGIRYLTYLIDVSKSYK